MVKFSLTWLQSSLRVERYFVSKKLNTAKLAKDVRARLIENGILVTSYIMDGMLFKLRGFSPRVFFVAKCMYGRFLKPVKSLIP